jgi:hypothetical protein
VERAPGRPHRHPGRGGNRQPPSGPASRRPYPLWRLGGLAEGFVPLFVYLVDRDG